jgi:DNA-directed RNA polymerase sigma subunit (sigma70/sigma32)
MPAQNIKEEWRTVDKSAYYRIRNNDKKYDKLQVTREPEEMDAILYPNNEKVLDDKLMVQHILDNVDLEKKDWFVLSCRNGLVDGIYHTYEEIGTELKCTRERVRQIEERALQEIRRQFA